MFMWARLDILLGAYELSLTPLQMSQHGDGHVGRGDQIDPCCRFKFLIGPMKDVDGENSLAFAVD